MKYELGKEVTVRNTFEVVAKFYHGDMDSFTTSSRTEMAFEQIEPIISVLRKVTEMGRYSNGGNAFYDDDKMVFPSTFTEQDQKTCIEMMGGQWVPSEDDDPDTDDELEEVHFEWDRYDAFWPEDQESKEYVDNRIARLHSWKAYWHGAEGRKYELEVSE